MLIKKSKGIDTGQTYKCVQCSYQTGSKVSLWRHLLVQNRPNTEQTFRCQECLLETKSKKNLEKHMLVHKDFDEIKAFKCHFCPYQAKYKESLTRHFRIHENCDDVAIYQCPECPHRSKTRSDLKKHMNAHQRTDEAGVFRCSQCSFGTKSKTVLTIHIEKVHKAFEHGLKCQHCPYQTNNKGDLKRHMLIHIRKNPNEDCIEVDRNQNAFKVPETLQKYDETIEIVKYNCEQCSYKTVSMLYLRKHMLTHSAAAESRIFRCHHCCLETKSKSNLKTHLRKLHNKQPVDVHAEQNNRTLCQPHSEVTTVIRDPIRRYEVRIHKCLQCSFETTSKTKLTRHLQGPNLPKKQMIFRCRKCPFETKSKEIMKKHGIVHKNFDETETFKCLSCPYRTKYKGSITRHLLTHGNYNEVAIFQCSECPHRSKNKSDLKKHLNTHNRTEETAIFKCVECSFSTNSKSVLTIHLGKAHKTSENKFKCHQCHYQTKNEKYLKRHTLLHVHKEVRQTETSPTTKLCENIFISSVIGVESHRQANSVIGPELWNSKSTDFEIIQCKYEHEEDFTAPEVQSEVEKYRCQQCSYETTNSVYHKKHVLIHQSNSKSPVLKCHECCFETRLKSNLKLHLRRMHKKNVGEITSEVHAFT